MHPPCSASAVLSLSWSSDSAGRLGNGLNSTLTGFLQKPLLLHTEANQVDLILKSLPFPALQRVCWLLGVACPNPTAGALGNPNTLTAQGLALLPLVFLPRATLKQITEEVGLDPATAPLAVMPE